jgi:hypothetical protein
MGRVHVRLVVRARLDDHGGEAQEQDEAAWERFCAEVEGVAARPEYAALISDSDIEWHRM